MYATRSTHTSPLSLATFKGQIPYQEARRDMGQTDP